MIATLRRPLAALALAAALTATGAVAQGLFAPVAEVGQEVVTNYELQQRIAFNRVVGAPGDIPALSLDQLIDDRVRLAAARRQGIDVPEEEILEGMSEFAGRAGLEREEFLDVLAQGGVAEETFRDFVEAGLAWRQVVRSRFLSRAQVSEAEIDRALAQSTGDGGLIFSLSEIILPARDPAERAEAERRAAQIAQTGGEAAFARSARAFSVVPSRGAGGRIDPIALGNMPPPLRDAVIGLAPGEVSQPLQLPNAIAIFLLRGIEETGRQEENVGAIDYAAFYIPGGNTPQTQGIAAGIRAEVDTCDDLYGVAQGLPEERLERGILPVEEIPADIALELAKLDDNEVSTAVTRAEGRTLVFLMLCGRTPAFEEGEESGPTRGQIATRLRNERIAGYADGFLAELRADAGVRILAQ